MPHRYRPLTNSLRSKLLIITVLFVTLVEAIVFLPSIATFRETFLSQTIKSAQLAALSLEASPANRISPELERSLLKSSGVVSLVMMRNNQSRMLGFEQMPADIGESYDLRSPSLGDLIIGAYDSFMAKGDRYINVVGTPSLEETRWIEATLYEEELYKAMVAHSSNLLILSVFISLSTGVLVYMTLHWVVVRPMRKLKDQIGRYRENPEDPDHLVQDSNRRDEIGIIARALHSSQHEVQQSFKQKKHLAELGEAISKINHDLRGMLTTASLASHTLSHFKDPKVMRITARLERALSRAIDLCTRTLKHGTASEPDPEIRPVNLSDLAHEVSDSFHFDALDSRMKIDVPSALIVYADREQLFRVFHNLVKNSLEAIEGKEGSDETKSGTVTLQAAEGDHHSEIRLTDTGPGFSDAARETLFKPFISSSRKDRGGSGLGLAIAREIIEAHGGSISLEHSSTHGSQFLIILPIRADWNGESDASSAPDPADPSDAS